MLFLIPAWNDYPLSNEIIVSSINLTPHFRQQVIFHTLTNSTYSTRVLIFFCQPPWPVANLCKSQFQSILCSIFNGVLFFLLQGIEHQMMKPLPGDLVVNDVSDTSVRCLQDGEEKDTELSSILSLWCHKLGKSFFWLVCLFICFRIKIATHEKKVCSTFPHFKWKSKAN